MDSLDTKHSCVHQEGLNSTFPCVHNLSSCFKSHFLSVTSSSQVQRPETQLRNCMRDENRLCFASDSSNTGWQKESTWGFVIVWQKTTKQVFAVPVILRVSQHHIFYYDLSLVHILAIRHTAFGNRFDLLWFTTLKVLLQKPQWATSSIMHFCILIVI